MVISSKFHEGLVLFISCNSRSVCVCVCVCVCACMCVCVRVCLCKNSVLYLFYVCLFMT